MANGVVFRPGANDEERKKRRQQDVQRAIQILSLRLPERIEGRSVAPAPLLEAGAMGGGTPMAAVLRSLLGQHVPQPTAPAQPVPPMVSPTAAAPQTPTLAAQSIHPQAIQRPSEVQQLERQRASLGEQIPAPRIVTGAPTPEPRIVPGPVAPPPGFNAGQQPVSNAIQQLAAMLFRRKFDDGSFRRVGGFPQG